MSFHYSKTPLNFLQRQSEILGPFSVHSGYTVSKPGCLSGPSSYFSSLHSFLSSYTSLLRFPNVLSMLPCQGIIFPAPNSNSLPQLPTSLLSYFSRSLLKCLSASYYHSLAPQPLSFNLIALTAWICVFYLFICVFTVSFTRIWAVGGQVLCFSCLTNHWFIEKF